MTSKVGWREEKRLRRLLTPLNLAISAAYDACRGKHVASGEFVIREFPIGQRQLPLCANCGCPFGKTNGHWGDPHSASKGGRR